MHIKTTVRYYLTPIRVATINKSTNNSAGEDVEEGDPFALLVGMQTGAATVEYSREIPQKIKNGSAFLPSYHTSANISKGTLNTNSKEYKHPVFTAVLLTITKIWKQPKCPPIDEWIKQLWDIYTVEFYLAVKK